MNIIKTDIEGLLVIEPRVFGDSRGYFFESYNTKAFEEAVEVRHPFVLVSKLAIYTARTAIQNDVAIIILNQLGKVAIFLFCAVPLA